MPSEVNRGRSWRRLGKSLPGRVRKVRKVRKVYSLIYGRRAISENECRGNYTSSIAQAAKTFRTFRTFRSAAGSTKRYMLREPDHAVLEAQLCGCAR